MTNLEKMNELVGAKADKKEIMQWAYMNRVLVDEIPEEKEFKSMKHSVAMFLKSDTSKTEYDSLNNFLDAKYIDEAYQKWIKQKWQEWQELNGLKNSWQMTERHHEEFDKWLSEEANE